MSCRLSILLVLGLAACSAHVDRREQSFDLPSCNFDLSEEGFIQELLDPRATPRTPDFDDYTEGSYHVNKLNLLSSLRESASENPSLLGVAVTGPYGPLWAYEVALFGRDGAWVRVNWLVMPHARITYKATRTLSSVEFDQFREAVLSSPALTPGLPVPATDQDPEGLDWSFGMATEFWMPTPRAAYLADTWLGTPTPALELASSLMDAVLKGSLVTYASDIPEELGSNTVCTDPERE
jgi:hypothetical protein